MPTYTVHAPPRAANDAATAADRFRFVRDGFHFWAFLVTPVWLLLHRLWLALLIYVVGFAAIEIGMSVARVPSNIQLLVGLLIALLAGVEASSIRRWTLTRRGWSTVGFVVGEDEELAERRFYGEWCSRRGSAPPRSETAEPKNSLPVRRGPPSPADVIGLFPEPGGHT